MTTVLIPFIETWQFPPHLNKEWKFKFKVSTGRKSNEVIRSSSPLWMKTAETS